uniref:signal peptidase I n=1 Tax=Parerythrobacter lutipelagi TaxID=1964208 RepID=UPI0010F82028|nr:signal peptidase I [Parerythrobacter lutipelagi]
MTEATADAANADDPTQSGSGDKPEKKEDNFFVFLLKLAVIVLVFRSFFFSPFNIPSESMLPRLMNGDYLIASKWAYGYTQHSLPYSAPLIPGRVFGGTPERGDIAIFKHPVDKADYIKRVIGVPGDMIGMREGQVILNGEPVPKEQIEDFVIPLSPNTRCNPMGEQITTEDGDACRYTQFRETLPGGKSYNVLDFGPTPQDNFGPIAVPEGKVFMMGDNRDNSQDSRFAAVSGGGVGLIDQELLVGRAEVLMWSTDGSAEWLLPWTWFTALRGSRVGDGL